MNSLLEERYQALFAAYGIGSSRVIDDAKYTIVSRMNVEGDLRPDAALFLLVNVDYMVWRACSAHIPDSIDGAFGVKQLHIHPEKIDGLIRWFIEDTFEHLEKNLRSLSLPTL